MSYQVRRIDPFWISHPMTIVLVAGGCILAFAGLLPVILSGGGAAAGVGSARIALVIAGAVFVGIGVLLLTKPAISAAAGTLGIMMGMFTFIILPSVDLADLSFPFKLLAALLFGLFYTVIMDVVVLIAVTAYNVSNISLGAVRIDLEESGAEGQ